MLSLETAKRLKESGLRRNEFKKGDCFYWDEPHLIIDSPIKEHEYPMVIYQAITVISVDEPKYKRYSFSRQGGFWNLERQLSEEESIAHIPKVVWTPSLSQLLAEIEARGWGYGLDHSFSSKKYRFGIYRGINGRDFKGKNFWGATPDEAAAQALLWILEQEVAAMSG